MKAPNCRHSSSPYAIEQREAVDGRNGLERLYRILVHLRNKILHLLGISRSRWQRAGIHRARKSQNALTMPSRKTQIQVHSFGIGTPKIIDDGLAEVIAIAQGSAGNVSCSRVDRLQRAQRYERSPLQEARVFREFLLAELDKAVGIRRWRSSCCPRSVPASSTSWAHSALVQGREPKYARLDISERGETLKAG